MKRPGSIQATWSERGLHPLVEAAGDRITQCLASTSVSASMASMQQLAECRLQKLVSSIHDEQSRFDKARAEQARDMVVLKVEQDVKSHAKHPPNGPLNVRHETLMRRSWTTGIAWTDL